MKYLFQHEINKRRAVCQFTTLFYGLIIAALDSIHHIFYRKMQKGRMEFSQNQRLPQTPDSAVAITEWVDELKLLVKYTAFYQEMVFCG